MTEIQYVLFDLDDTIYNNASGLFEEVGGRIEGWLSRTLEVSSAQARKLRVEYYRAYGTTMRGLLIHHPEVDIDDYLDDVHQVMVAHHLEANPALAAMLARLPVEKVIFTNGIADWAERVLACLGVREHFTKILDVRALDYTSKPFPEAYQKALQFLGVPGDACVLVDDQARNLQGGAKFGMRTVLVRPESQPGGGVEFAVSQVLETEPILTELLAL